MKFIVEGKEFSNYEEAQKYEEELNKKKYRDNYKDFLESNMRVFKCHDRYENSDIFFAVVAEKDHELYAHVMAEKEFGSRLGFNSDMGIVFNWEIAECDQSTYTSIVQGMVEESIGVELPVIVFSVIQYDDNSNKDCKYVKTEDSRGNCDKREAVREALQGFDFTPMSKEEVEQLQNDLINNSVYIDDMIKESNSIFSEKDLRKFLHNILSM